MANGLKVLLKNANVINAKVLLPKVDFSEDTIEPSHVLAGDTYHDENGKNVGTMPINESEAVVFSSASDTYRIAEGYHDGNGVVRIAYFADLVPENMLEGTEILGIQGGIPVNTSETIVFSSASDTYTIPRGFHDGTGIVRIASNPDLNSQNILSGKTILGIQGGIPVITPESVTFDSADDEYVIPRGYHDGTERISIASNPDLLPENIKAGVTILGIVGTLDGAPTLPDGDEMLFGDPTANIVGVGQSGSMIVTEPSTDAFADYGVVDSAIVL